MDKKAIVGAVLSAAVIGTAVAIHCHRVKKQREAIQHLDDFTNTLQKMVDVEMAKLEVTP